MSAIVRFPIFVKDTEKVDGCESVDISEAEHMSWRCEQRDDPAYWRCCIVFHVGVQVIRCNLCANEASEIARRIVGADPKNAVEEIQKRSGIVSEPSEDAGLSLSVAVRDWCAAMLEKLVARWEDARFGADYPPASVVDLLPLPEPSEPVSDLKGETSQASQDLAKSLACALSMRLAKVAENERAAWMRAPARFYVSMDASDAVAWAQKPYFDKATNQWTRSDFEECAAISDDSIPSWFLGGLAFVEACEHHGCTAYVFRWLELMDGLEAGALAPAAGFVVQASNGRPLVQAGGWAAAGYEGSGIPGILQGNWPDTFRAHVADLYGAAEGVEP